MPKYYLTPFAAAGDKTAIPETAPPDGKVSYPSGYGVDYQLDKTTNPNALFVERDKFNELMYDVTNNLQYWQQLNHPAFITSSDNGGTPFPYAKKALVRFLKSDSTIGLYESLADNNTESPELSPGVPSKQWQEIAFKLNATDTGTVNNVRIFSGTPLTVTSNGVIVTVKVTNTNTGSVTIQIGNTESVYTVQVGDQGVLGNVRAGMLIANSVYNFIFNGSTYILVDPSPIPEPIPGHPVVPVPHATVRFSSSYTQPVSGGSVDQPVKFDYVESDVLGWWDSVNFRMKPSFTGYYDATVQLIYTTPAITKQVLNLISNVTGGPSVRASFVCQNASINQPDNTILVLNNIQLNGTTDSFFVGWTNSGTFSTILGLTSPLPAQPTVDSRTTCIFTLTYRGPLTTPSLALAEALKEKKVIEIGEIDDAE